MLLACSAGAGDSSDSSESAVGGNLIDIRADNNRDGVISFTDPTEDADEDQWTDNHGAIFLANIDDDTRRCPNNVDDLALAACNDAADEIVNGPDDALDLARIKTKPSFFAPQNLQATVTWTAADKVRLFKVKSDGTFQVVQSGYAMTTEDIQRGLELAIEGKDILREPNGWDGTVDVTVNASVGAQTDTDTVRLRMAPLVASNHLDDGVMSIASAVPDRNNPSQQDPGNKAMTDGLDAAHLAAGLPEPGLFQTYDRWAQDFFEPGYMTMPAKDGKQQTMRANMRSSNINVQYRPNPTGTGYVPFIDPRNPIRVAGRIVFALRGKDSAGVQAFDLTRLNTNPNDNDSLNSFGNMETVPPFTHNGVTWPVGRIIRGSTENADQGFERMLQAQKVQKPIRVNTEWLLVGHVDETLSFVKANTPRGWKLLINDARWAIQMLEDEVARGNGDVPMFVGKNWREQDPSTGAEVLRDAKITIKDVLADATVMAATAEAAVEVDEQVRIIKQETGLTDDEILRAPFLHTHMRGYSVAYHPGTVNGIYIGPKDFASPDPHGPVIDGKDIYKVALEQELATVDIKTHWVEDWDGYHINIGEVHCGSNVLRSFPTKTWWMSGSEVQ
ncbi:MAG: hypothetical protein KIT84_07830 [Labilithrix sp.]|nr:hypothetical protein [Labilithrix sp.]